MCMYMLKIIYSHIDHTLWSTECLWVCSLIFDESRLKENSYMVSELYQILTWYHNGGKYTLGLYDFFFITLVFISSIIRMSIGGVKILTNTKMSFKGALENFWEPTEKNIKVASCV